MDLNNSKVIMALSGGMDSTTLLGFLLDSNYEVECVSFVYGSKHNSYEREAAEHVVGYYGVPLHKLDLSSVMSEFDSHLLKSGGSIPEGHYTDTTMSKTVVPGRNIIFLSILAGIAWSCKASKIAIGIHLGDHAIYEDCRKEFYKAMDSAIYLGTGGRVEILAPFIKMNKTSILKWGLEESSKAVPYHFTRTCYKDQILSCGRCGACQERKEAFETNGVVDPIQYEEVGK